MKVYRLIQRKTKVFDVEGTESLAELIYENIENVLKVDNASFIINEVDLPQLKRVFEDDFADINDYVNISEIELIGC